VIWSDDARLLRRLFVTYGELIDLLRREPYVMREQDYGYRGSGWLDRAARALGWLGVVGLVLLRRRRTT
jgi:hypothetical protein